MVRTGLLVVSIIFIATLGARSAGAEILIGVATAMTGPMAWEGSSNQVGAESAVADLNETGGGSTTGSS